MLRYSLNTLDELDEINSRKKKAIDNLPLILSELGEPNSSDIAALDPGLGPDLFP
jgi:hypothetical protein